MGAMRVAVIPGDGIGQEVMVEALKVLDILQKLDSSFVIQIESFEWNSEYYLRTGRMMPEDSLETLRVFDAILFGAIGDDRVPDEISIWQLIMPIRKQFQQYVNIRPIQSLPGINIPLKQEQPIDFVIMRENAEGEYSDMGGRLYQNSPQEMAVQNTVMTRIGIERIATFAFEYARLHNKNKVTSATKSNAVIHAMKLWDEVIEEVSHNYKEIQLEKNYIDALAAYLIMRPSSFEVIIASNLFGDILSDLGAALVGGLGMAPSANINPEKIFPSMFEPVHGSAPDIAGLYKANPIAQVWSTALMLEHLGRADLSEIVMKAIYSILSQGIVKTPDLGGSSSTFQVGNEIIRQIHKQF
ncbi:MULTISPECIES: tartrate dehydrogenase [Bacillus]|uniref:tartrate dehydrogenase n=1 Tax=Bacillus TaxID=1386 RepID=UPI0002D9EACF|nr:MULTISPECIES: tartrate dehydrogenase [Bacillus]